MQRKRFLILTSGLAIVLAMASVTAAKRPVTTPSLDINPANFVANVDNKYFPLQPGTTFFYKGEKEGIPTSDAVNVTHKTKRILGVNCIVVHHKAYEDGVLIEDTLDFYAQDVQGTVWYFGEDTKELDEFGNVVSTAGTWEAGVDDAKPGIIMEAHPRVGDRYQQEVAPGVAEDMAQVLRLDQSKCVRYGCFDDLPLIKEWSPLDPGVVEYKYYAEGIGFILGIMVQGGNERTELVRIDH